MPFNNTQPPENDYGDTAMYAPLIFLGVIACVFGYVWVSEKLRKLCQRKEEDPMLDIEDMHVEGSYNSMSPNELLTAESLAKFEAELQTETLDSPHILRSQPSRLIIHSANGLESPSSALMTPHSYVLSNVANASPR